MAVRSPPSAPNLGGASVPARVTLPRPVVLSPAARRAITRRMLLVHETSIEHVARVAGVDAAELKPFRSELAQSDLAETLVGRGAGLAFVEELPQAPLLYLLTRALRPNQVVETGIGPGYSTAWILAALAANGAGELISVGPGPTAGRGRAVHPFTVGQFVPPRFRDRWTLVLGNTEDRLAEILKGGTPLDLYFYDNGPEAARAHFELRAAWSALSGRGVLLSHHVDANSAWPEFCRSQGLAPQILSPGPPPMGALAMHRDARF
ncbi:MAG TPA: class I SAM-dependent methyltransferase [Thermoplasmata archaeon]|nr:class I SAM-dependent methyltransferase [Thermoplasmata archaeon]